MAVTSLFFGTTEIFSLDADNPYGIQLLTPFLPAGEYSVVVTTYGFSSNPYYFTIIDDTTTSMMDAVSTYSDNIGNRLLYQYKDKEKIVGLHRSLIGNPVQKLSNAVYTLARQWDINNAYGDQLDKIGNIVGQSREGLDDIYYRQYIKARALANGSNGSLNVLITICLLVTGAESIQLIAAHEEGAGSAAYRVIITESPSLPIAPENYLVIYNMIKDATGLGIGVTSVTIVNGNDDFELGDLPVGPATEVIDYQTGLGDYTQPAIGGQFATIILG